MLHTTLIITSKPWKQRGAGRDAQLLAVAKAIEAVLPVLPPPPPPACTGCTAHADVQEVMVEKHTCRFFSLRSTLPASTAINDQLTQGIVLAANG